MNPLEPSKPSMTQPPRNTKAGAFCHLKSLGVYPATVIDVGVQQGTPELYEAFPQSLHILIEPVAEQEPYLKLICSRLSLATYMVAAAADHCGTGTLRITKNLQYSGLVDGTGTPNTETHFDREVPTITLDELSRQGNIPKPVLLKIDVDGRELLVLNGAKELFKEKLEYVVIEATLFDQIHDVINFMLNQNFVLYDILEPSYRPLDNALWQADLAFVPRDGRLRAHTEYAKPEIMQNLRLGGLTT